MPIVAEPIKMAVIKIQKLASAIAINIKEQTSCLLFYYLLKWEKEWDNNHR